MESEGEQGDGPIAAAGERKSSAHSPEDVVHRETELGNRRGNDTVPKPQHLLAGVAAMAWS